MSIYTLKRTQIVKMPLRQCWDFFSDPRNLEKITPPAMRFRIQTDLPAKVYPGMMIEYKVSPLFGLPLSWLTEIVQVDEPNYFADEQRVGPYRLWHHEHFFCERSSQEVEVRDLIHYVPPLGPLGFIVDRLAIRPQLARIFDFRAESLERMSRLGSPDSFA